MAPVGVLFGGPSPEHDVSILTGLQAARALHDEGADVCCLYWTKTGRWLRVPPTTEAAAFLEPDVSGASEIELVVPIGFVERKRLRSTLIEIEAVLNCCHGGPGEDGSLTAMLLLAGLPVSGPSPQACALAMDKFATAAVAQAIGVPMIETSLVGLKSGALPTSPWVVKPRFGGSSIGVEADIQDLETVSALGKSGVGRAGMLLQPFLQGWTDLSVAVKTYPQLLLSPIERPLRKNRSVYGYEDKYLTGGSGMDAAPRELPAVLPTTVCEAVAASARALVTAMGMTGAPRVDFMWDGADSVLFCEVNAIPGAWGNHLWKEIGVPRTTLYRDLLAEAQQPGSRPPQWTSASDGKALRMSDSIASKLA